MNFRDERREGFVQWYGWSLQHKDADPSLYMLDYLFKRYEHNIEQILWMCWLYGTTYYAPTAWVVWNEFPDYELVGVDRLDEWNTNNYLRLRYQTDTRYNKGHLPTQFESYQKWIGNRSQMEHFRTFLKEDPHESFNLLWKSAKDELFKFGRYSTWFYLQTLRHCAKLKIEAPNLMLDDYGGSRSHRNGLCMALGKDEWYDAKLSSKDTQYLEDSAQDILREVKARFPGTDAEFFTMESCLCSYKKIFRLKQGRYLGYYLDRQAEEISRVEADGWNGIDWSPFWNARVESLDPNLSQSNRVQEDLMATPFKHHLSTETEPDFFSSMFEGSP